VVQATSWTTVETVHVLYVAPFQLSIPGKDSQVRSFIFRRRDFLDRIVDKSGLNKVLRRLYGYFQQWHYILGFHLTGIKIN